MPADTLPALHPGAAVAANADGFPALPGIDTAAGLRRMMNKTALYERVLREFHQRFRDEAAQIRTAMESGDPGAALRRVHSAKGLAGSLGAAELQAAASDLEAAIKEGADDLAGRMDRFDAALRIVIGGIAAAFGLD